MNHKSIIPAIIGVSLASMIWFGHQYFDMQTPPAYLLIGVVLLITALFYIVQWHAATHGYRCPECDHTFAVTAWTDFINPHCPGCIRLRCPKCNKRSWCQEILRNKVTIGQDT